MKLLNFSIGRVQTVKIGNESVRTAHVKEPVPEPWRVTPEGAEGDERAVHPDKIYAYAREGYAYWGEQLRVDPAQWPDGFFGENLTFDTLDEDALRIGDVFAVGEEVRLVVAGPRNPCLKLSWRLGQPPTFQKVFQISHRTGVYFGVLQAGVVRRGDSARRIAHDPSMPSVAEIAHFAAGHAAPPLTELRRLLDFEHLSGTIRFILQAKVHAAERSAGHSEGRWRGWRTFRIERIVAEAPEIRSFYLAPSDALGLCKARPGQFVTVQIRAADGSLITRCWSLSAHATPGDPYRLTVRRQMGPGSQWLHAAKIGDEVRLRAPAGEFALDLGGYRPVVLVAAGIGITPLIAMLQAHLDRGPGAPVIHLFYGARTPHHVAFRGELDALAAAHANLRIEYVYSGGEVDGRPAGRITSEWLVNSLQDLHVSVGGRRVSLPWFENDTYICGPGDFCANLKSGLVARGANADHIFFELFSSTPSAASDLDIAEVRFRRSRLTHTWRAEEDLTLLELAESAGIEISSDCRAGACLTCKTAVAAGATTSDLGDGTALLCVGRPKTTLLELDC